MPMQSTTQPAPRVTRNTRAAVTDRSLLPLASRTATDNPALTATATATHPDDAVHWRPNPNCYKGFSGCATASTPHFGSGIPGSNPGSPAPRFIWEEREVAFCSTECLHRFTADPHAHGIV